MLTRKIAQRIADEVMETLGYNINVMNDRGIIIGSGSASRIGTFHEAAMKAIEDRTIHEVSEREATELHGVKPGINMPIFSGGTVVGVVGITGDPDEVRPIGRLVKMAAELILEQEESTYRFYLHRNDKEAFVTGLLNDTAAGHADSLKRWGESLGYDLALPRVACLMEFSTPAPQGASWREERIERIKCSRLHLRQDISVVLSGSILVFKTISDVSPWGIEQQVGDYVESILQELDESERNQMRCWVGGYYRGIGGYQKSYHDASRLSAVMGERAQLLNFTHRNLLYLLFEGLSDEVRQNVLQPYVNRLEEQLGDGTCEALRTAQHLIDNGFRYEQTAEELFVHKNTVAFRKKKLDQCLQLQPKENTGDLLLLKMILLQYASQRENS